MIRRHPSSSIDPDGFGDRAIYDAYVDLEHWLFDVALTRVYVALGLPIYEFQMDVLDEHDRSDVTLEPVDRTFSVILPDWITIELGGNVYTFEVNPGS